MADQAASQVQWDELRKEMQDFFNEFDVNNSKKLGVDEITAILKSVGLRCTNEEVREMMSEVAGPQASEINFDELMKILEKHTYQEDEDKTIAQSFSTIDVDGDGVISAEDLQCFMQSIGEDFELKYAIRMIKAATGSDDPNATVNLETYKATLHSRWAQQGQ